MHLYCTMPRTTQDICNFYVTETFKCLYFVQLLIYIFLIHFNRLMYKYMRLQHAVIQCYTYDQPLG